MPKTDVRKGPAFLETARALYGDAFEHRRKTDVAAAMDEWGELDEADQGFTLAHLLYLNLKAQAETLRVLGDVRELLDEVADGLDEALDDDEPEDGGATRGGDDRTVPSITPPPDVVEMEEPSAAPVEGAAGGGA